MHEMRFDTAKEVVHVYHEYIRLLRGEACEEAAREGSFDRVHSLLLAKALMARVLFGESISKDLRALARRLANVKNLQADGNRKRAGEQLMMAYSDAGEVVVSMFNVLRGRDRRWQKKTA